MAAAAAWSASPAVTLSHFTYGAAATSIAVAAGPSQGPPVSSVTVDPYHAAVELSSADSSPQAAAAASRGPAPGPEYIRPELISGGNAPKSITSPFLSSPPRLESAYGQDPTNRTGSTIARYVAAGAAAGVRGSTARCPTWVIRRSADVASP